MDAVKSPHSTQRTVFALSICLSVVFFDWVTAAKNMGKWHLGVEKGAQELEDAWRCADKRESDRRHRREAAALRAANRRIAPARISC